MNYILDTNILLTYSRENKISQKVEADLNLFQTGNNLIVSVVTVGEIESILLRSKLGGKRSLVIEKMLSQVAVLDINIEELIKNYGRIEAFSQGKLPSRTSSFTARNMGKNDLWISATAATFNLTLVTMDRDFDHLHEEFLELIYVDLNKYK